MSTIHRLISKPIGAILQEANLINEGQIQVALQEQIIYDHLRVGEILALHGWISQKTADFFGETIEILIETKQQKRRFGYYLFEADLISQADVDSILLEQQKTGIKFGSLAVLQGYIKQQTLDFFLKYFVGEISNQNYRSTQTGNDSSQSQKLLVNSFEDSLITIEQTGETLSQTTNYSSAKPTLINKAVLHQKPTTKTDNEEGTQELVAQQDWEDIPWID